MDCRKQLQVFLFLQSASSNMDLLPSREELDNTGFRAGE